MFQMDLSPTSYAVACLAFCLFAWLFLCQTLGGAAAMLQALMRLDQPVQCAGGMVAVIVVGIDNR